jgi:hypothetical protein
VVESVVGGLASEIRDGRETYQESDKNKCGSADSNGLENWLLSLDSKPS